MEHRALTVVTRTQGNNEALKNKTVTPRNVDLEFVEIPVLVDGFRRMVRQLEFDISEMAITTYLCAKDHGVHFTAIPVFLVREFHHKAMMVNTKAGITQPKDLQGTRVGVNRGYTVTTGVWARGILQDEYNVDLSKITWVPSGDEHVQQYQPPANVEPMPAGGDLAAMVDEGTLTAAVGAELEGSNVAHLIDNPSEAAFESLRRRGLYPINHLVVIRDELLEDRPELAGDIFDAFAQAKNQYVERLRKDEIASPNATDRMFGQVMQITDADPLPYGIAPNRAMIDLLIDHAVTQKILSHRPATMDLFAEATRDLIA